MKYFMLMYLFSSDVFFLYYAMMKCSSRDTRVSDRQTSKVNTIRVSNMYIYYNILYTNNTAEIRQIKTI